MHWFWRAAIAAVVGATPTCILNSQTGLILKVCRLIDDILAGLSLPTDVRMALTLMLADYIWPCLFAVVVFTLLTRFLGPEHVGYSDTRCRECHYILKGITEPRCPECGERI